MTNRIDRAIDAMDEISNQVSGQRVLSNTSGTAGRRAGATLANCPDSVPLVAAPEASGSGAAQSASLPTPNSGAFAPDLRSRRTTVWTATPQWDTQNHQWYVLCPHCTNDCGEAEKHMFCDFCGKNFDCEWETEAEEEQ